MVTWLIGKKTYIFAGIAAIATFCFALGWIDNHTWEAIMGFCMAGGGAALRASVERIGKEQCQGEK